MLANEDDLLHVVLQLQIMHPISQAGIVRTASQQLSHAFQMIHPDPPHTILPSVVLPISFVGFNSPILHWKRLIAEENLDILLARGSHA